MGVRDRLFLLVNRAFCSFVLGPEINLKPVSQSFGFKTSLIAQKHSNAALSLHTISEIFTGNRICVTLQTYLASLDFHFRKGTDN